MGRSGRRVLAVLAIAGLGLAVTACGGDDDDEAAPAAEAAGDENADAEDNGDDGDDNAEAEAEDDGDEGDNAEAEDDGDDDTIKVDSINDIPDECIDLFTDFLKKIEPIVEDVDWENADLSAMESITDQLDDEVSGMDDEMESAGCNDYELDDDASLDALIELAQDEAPGTVAYFEFIKNLQESFSDVTVPDVSIPEVSIPDVDTGDGADEGDDGDGGVASDVPQDCEGAIAYLEDLMEKYDSMMDMSIDELTAMGDASSVITTTCSVNEMNDFYSRSDVQEWMSGT